MHPPSRLCTLLHRVFNLTQEPECLFPLAAAEPPDEAAGTFTIRSSQVAVSAAVLEGTFVASGMIDDHGTLREELNSAEPLARQSSIHSVKTLVSEKGSITIEFYAGLSPVRQNVLRATGGFYIVEGSGAYAGLQGSGKIDQEVAANASPAALTQVLEGIAQYAR